jgi:thiamine monophosphate synthase
LRGWLHKEDRRFVAIGGISANVRDVLNAGADAVAVISAIVSSPDIGAQLKDYRNY